MPRRHRDHSASPHEASQRQLRVGEELRHALAQLLRPGELRDPALSDANVTVTEVRISPDLRNATAFVMPLGGSNADGDHRRAEAQRALSEGPHRPDGQPAAVPNLAFALDRAFDSAEHIAELLPAPRSRATSGLCRGHRAEGRG